ncbi:hypothetical protein BU26DRAFT_601870 [Trematosphaeria pertusa]|uniref:Peptidase C15, pyroglutamyl peptidase I-like protein n=1 Tax=Trematosphaeria pertusa TaxID=390896 RepID=A0A6A6ITH8_9PLEO|nr:uncharacterized protein BU26DRAFT_601870 [Trematosphaeria pertusa]KAF2253825.1 hypothetical protein BU26DRAFT_601870 [Trematosphaeria pertusa]
MPRVIFRDEKPNIRIIIYPDPIWTGWEEVRKLVPKLWDAEKDTFRMYVDPEKSKTMKIDAMVHMGILDKPNLPWRFERYPFTSGYELPGTGGKTPTDEDKTGGGRWKALPDRLETGLNLDSIYERVCSQVDESKVIISEDPNRFLCAYIYYASLAELHLRDEKKSVVFMHTPIEHESKDIERSVNVVCTVVKAMVEDLEKSESDEK